MHRHNHPALPYVALATSVIAAGALWFSLSGLNVTVEQSTAHAATPEPTSSAQVIEPSAPIDPSPSPSVTPCPTEDSTGCYWDASEQGNGLGHDVDATQSTDVEPTHDEPWVAPCTTWLADNHIDMPCKGEPVDWPFSNAETLVCGPDAKPALDYSPDGIGWWAYCEPALVP